MKVIPNHNKFYSFAEAYDIAFDFRNVASECDFLLSVAKKHKGAKINSFLELGAGNAAHSIEMASRSIITFSVDLSEEMRKYALEKALHKDASINYLLGDMIEFSMDTKADLAVLLMASTGYLLTNENVYSHLKSVAGVLNEKGIYILEMPHPRDVFEVGKFCQSDWKMERDGKKTHVVWGKQEDLFDPITQISNTTVTLTYESNGRTETMTEIASQRCFTATEFRALVDANGCFKIIDIFGSMDSNIPFNNDKKAWRMVLVLQKL